MKNIFISFLILSSLSCFAQKTQYIGTKTNTVEVRNNLRIKALKNNATMDSVLITTPEGDVVQVDNRFYLLSPLQSFDSIGLTWIRCVGCGGGGGGAVNLQQAISNGSILTQDNTINSGIYKQTFVGTGNSLIVANNSGNSGVGVYGRGDSSNSYGIVGYSMKGNGMQGYGYNGIGVQALTATGTALKANCLGSGLPAELTYSNINNHIGIVTGLRIKREASSTSNGFGISIDYNLRGTNADSLAARDIVKWSNYITGTAERNFQQRIFGNISTTLTLKGSGQVQLPYYGVGANGGTPSYDIQTDANGNLIEKVSEVFIDVDMIHFSEYTVQAPGIYNLKPNPGTNFNLGDPNGSFKKFVVINTTGSSQDCTNFNDVNGSTWNEIKNNYVYTFYSDGTKWIGIKNN